MRSPLPEPPTTVADCLSAAVPRLGAAGIGSARLDAELLLACVLGCGRTSLWAHPERPVDGAAARRFEALVTRRVGREPIAYLTGVREFWSLEFAVGAGVLVPRPETELLVEGALARAPRAPGARCDVADLCTGSACVAVALARELPGARVLALDLSAEALAWARTNVARHAPGRVSLVRADLWSAVSARARFDLVVSNPPYIASAEVDTLEPDVRSFEPRLALDGGADGLDVIRPLVAGAAVRLRPGGWLLLELGAGGGPGVRATLESAGVFDVIELVRDGAGYERIAHARRRPD